MSRPSPAQYERHIAARKFEDIMARLRLELRIEKPCPSLRHLQIYIDYLEYLVERTGGTAETEAFRTELAEVKREIAARGVLRDLRLVSN
jgi:hypothetical protein